MNANTNTAPAALVTLAAAFANAYATPALAAAALAAAAPAALAPDAIDRYDLAAALAALTPFDPESPATPADCEDEAADILAALHDLAADATATDADATPAADTPNATLAALAAHNAAPRKAYKLTAGDTLAALTLDGVTAYYAKTLDQWAGGFAGTDYAIESATTAVKHNKRGDYLEVVAATANFGKVHITTNSTTSIDYRRLTASFVKKCDNRAARAANKSANTGRRAPMSDVKRAAQAVNRYAAAAVKRLDGDKNANKKLRTMITNHLSSVCIERDVNRADVVAALNDATRAFVS